MRLMVSTSGVYWFRSRVDLSPNILRSNFSSITCFLYRIRCLWTDGLLKKWLRQKIISAFCVNTLISDRARFGEKLCFFVDSGLCSLIFCEREFSAVLGLQGDPFYLFLKKSKPSARRKFSRAARSDNWISSITGN